jgi:hypothetical protein
MGDVDRNIGELTADVRTLRDTVAELRAEIKHLREEFSQVRGGWKVVVTMAALAGGGLSWLTTTFVGKH